MADIDATVPPWLIRNWQPHDKWDPSPWLQERYRRQVEAQKLPLQLQELELRNREATLAIESKGLANDVLAQEQSDYAADLPLIKESLALAEKTPGGALTLPVPAFRSKRAQAAWLMRQKTDAATSYGMSVEQRIIDQTKRATAAMAIPGVPTLRPGRDGLFDEDELRQAEQIATQYRTSVELQKIKARDTMPAAVEEAEYLSRYKQQERLLQQQLRQPEDEFPGQGAVLKELLSNVQTKIQSLEARHGMEEITVQTPTGETVKVTKGGRQQSTPDDLTIANKTKAQESVKNSVMAIDAADRLLPLINTETVGPKAFVESWVNDRVLANFFPGMLNEKRVTAERLAAEMRTATVRQLRTDGQISEPERRQIEKAVPEINAPLDSPGRARELVISSQKTAAIMAFVQARSLGVPVPAAALRVLTLKDLHQMTNSGLISLAEAKALARQIQP